jgi:hypothetical protein
MEGWNDGRMKGWKDVRKGGEDERKEGGKDGRMEGWKEWKEGGQRGLMANIVRAYSSSLFVPWSWLGFIFLKNWIHKLQ